MMILSSYDDIIFQESRCHSPTATPADGKILSFSVVSVTGRASLWCIAWCNCSSLERERVAEKLGNPLFLQKKIDKWLVTTFLFECIIESFRVGGRRN